MEEQQLIAGLKSRDPAAVQELLNSCGHRLLRSAYLLCGNATEAEDLVQETFLEAFRSVHRFGGRSSVYTWLHAILINLTRHYHRKRKRLVCDDDLARQDLPVIEANQLRSDSAVASSALASALRRLSTAHREVLILRFYENLKIGDIARLLGISRGTVKSRLHYAIAEMQKLLPDELNLFGDRGTKRREENS